MSYAEIFPRILPSLLSVNTYANSEGWNPSVRARSLTRKLTLSLVKAWILQAILAHSESPHQNDLGMRYCAYTFVI